MCVTKERTMYKGSDNTSCFFVGDNSVSAIYLGTELVYSAKPDYSTMYLTVEATGPGDFNINRANISYSINGAEWATTTGASTLSLSDGDVVRFKAISTGYNLFTGSTVSFIVYGNVESIEYGDNFIGQTTMVATSGTFNSMFHSCSCLTDASNLILPATTLVQSCYQSMFYDCTSLSGAPELNASYVPKQAYRQMFYNCHPLNYVKCLATSIFDDGSNSAGTYRWLRYTAATGTFVKASDMASWQTGESGIPEGWTINNA